MAPILLHCSIYCGANISCKKICKNTKYHFRLFFICCFLVWFVFFLMEWGCLVLGVFWLLGFCYCCWVLAQFYNIIASDYFSYS